MSLKIYPLPKGVRSRRRQTADGRRQTADGRRQTADGRRQTADGRRQTADGRRQTADGRRQAAGGRRQAAGGRRHTAHGTRHTAGSEFGLRTRKRVEGTAADTAIGKGKFKPPARTWSRVCPKQRGTLQTPDARKTGVLSRGSQARRAVRSAAGDAGSAGNGQRAGRSRRPAQCQVRVRTGLGAAARTCAG